MVPPRVAMRSDASDTQSPFVTSPWSCSHLPVHLYQKLIDSFFSRLRTKTSRVVVLQRIVIIVIQFYSPCFTCDVHFMLNRMYSGV